MADEWGALCAATLTPKYVANKLLISYGGLLTVGGGGAGRSRTGETTRRSFRKSREISPVIRISMPGLGRPYMPKMMHG